MNMLVPHRRNPSRRRQAPKRFEDEKFVSGRVDQYTRGYEGRDSNWRAAEEAHDHRDDQMAPRPRRHLPADEAVPANRPQTLRRPQGGRQGKGRRLHGRV